MIRRLGIFVLFASVLIVGQSHFFSSQAANGPAETSVSLGEYRSGAEASGLVEIADAGQTANTARGSCKPAPHGLTGGFCSMDAAGREQTADVAGRQRRLVAWMPTAPPAPKSPGPDLRPPILAS